MYKPLYLFIDSDSAITRMSKKHCSRMESLPHEVVERILERLAVKPLLRFKAVSKQWRSTIQSRFFQERHLRHREESGDPDVLMVSVSPQTRPDIAIESLRTLVLGSSSSVKIPTPWEKTHYLVSHSTCDGLVCLYETHKSGFVVNPTTRWYRPLPLCEVQQSGLINYELEYENAFFNIGFGKDKFTGTYKPICLYNSAEIGREDATTCQVFDFCTNSWRYVTPASPYRVFASSDPVFLDGSLHWFTECQEAKVLSFDLHTESFQVISKAPFAKAHPYEMVMCNLNNRLCVSVKRSSNQVIWSFNSGNKTWDKLCSLDLDLISLRFDIRKGLCPLLPLALLDGHKKTKKKKLLFYNRVLSRTLVIHDPETKSYDAAFSAESIGYPVCYFSSLISIS